MARIPRPWFWEARNGWYVTIRGVRHVLGEDKDAAKVRFHELMAAPEPVVSIRSDSIVVLIDIFLDWVNLHRAEDTYVWYQYRLQLFAQRYPDLTVGQLKPFHIQQWIDGYK